MRVKGGIGALLVIAEEDDYGTIKSWKAVVVDGEAIKEDTWYRIIDGKLVVDE